MRFELKAVALLFFCCALTYGAFDIMAERKRGEGPSDEQQISLSLEAESTIIKQGESFFVTIIIRNTSGKEFQLRMKPTIQLDKEGQSEEDKRRLGPNFWSSVSVLSSLPPDSKIKQRATLLDGEEVRVRVNLSELKWGQSISSGYPSKNIFDLAPRGNYSLYSELEVEGDKDSKVFKRIKSNELFVQVD